MTETLMSQLYYPALRRRVEDLKARHAAIRPKRFYLAWYDTEDRNDPIMVAAPGKEWWRGDPLPPPGFDLLPDGKLRRCPS